jgi:hypothetical protein
MLASRAHRRKLRVGFRAGGVPLLDAADRRPRSGRARPSGSEEPSGSKAFGALTPACQRLPDQLEGRGGKLCVDHARAPEPA